MEKLTYHSYRSLSTLSPEKPKVLIATGNPDRVDGFYAWLAHSGIAYSSVEVVNGWEAEPGITTQEKACGKVEHAIDVYTGSIGDPRQALLVMAADSVNIAPDGALREKPNCEETVIQYHHEWLRSAVDGRPVKAESGVSVTLYEHGRENSVSMTDQVSLLPMDQEFINRVFSLNNGRVYSQAHGLGAYPFIRTGDIKASSGAFVVSPNEAIARIQGTWNPTIDRLVSDIFGRRSR